MGNAISLVIGLLIVGAMFAFTSSVTPQEIEQIKLTQRMCNANVELPIVGNVPLGAIGRSVSGEMAQGCSDVEAYAMLIPVYTYRLPLYAIGILLIVFGIFSGNSQSQVIVRNIKSHATNPMQKLADHKFCHHCGEQIPSSSTFCKFCGTKLCD